MDQELDKKESPSSNPSNNVKIIEQQHNSTTRDGKKVVKRSSKRLARQSKNGRAGKTKGQSKVKEKIKDAAWRLHDEALGSDETMSQLVQARRQIQNARHRYHQAKKVGKYSYQATKGTAKVGYKLGKTTTKYSYKATKYTAKKVGKYSHQITKATVRTASKYSYKAGKAAIKANVKATRKAAQIAAKAAQQTAAFVSKVAAAIVVNPVSWIVAAAVGIILLLVIILASLIPTSVVQQTEFTLNQSWIQISKTDREKSTDEVDYYTDIDPILHYMNYRYGGEWEPDASWNEGTGGVVSGFLGFNHYSDALNDIWLSLNKDKENLKTMQQVYEDDGKDWMKFDKDDLAEYKELLETKDEVGYYPSYQELSNPLESPNSNKEAETPVTITKRYGYVSKDEIDPTTTIQAEGGQKLYAPMDGKAIITEKDLLGQGTDSTNLIISSKDAKFIFYNIQNLKVKDGQEIKEGDELGSVEADAIDFKIAYAKKYGEVDNSDSSYLKDIRDEKSDYGFKDGDDVWVLVNPGFYFQFVTYTQKTSVVTDYNLSGELGGRIDQTWELIKKYYPKATKNGAAALMGNYMVESGINPKRAEGDYLNPPVGATATSWDDANWLNIGGPSIYNGRYPNIIHRGIGLGQWTDTADGSTRHTMLREYAKKKGKKWYDLELQIDFIFNGDNPYYTNYAKEILGSNEDVAELTSRFLVYWEGNPGDKLLQRQEAAKQVLARLNNGGGASSIKPNGKYAPMFAEPYQVLQPYGRTPWSSGAGAYLYAASGGKHTGIDFAPANLNPAKDYPVYSVTDGTVYSVSYSDLGGHAITIRPEGTDYYLYYGHLKYAPNFTQGQKIKAGQQIAVLGRSGMTNIYHVHFELSTSPYMSTGKYDLDPSAFFITQGTLKQNQVLQPK